MENQVRFAERFNDIEMFRYCEQCGRCSSACPITGINEFNIRRLIRHVELDLIEEIAASPMPWFCAACGRCEDACPNGISVFKLFCLAGSKVQQAFDYLPGRSLEDELPLIAFKEEEFREFEK